MSFLSIIIPVYNAEKYLNNTLTVLGQELSDEMEVVIIDDGSTDNSLAICNGFAEKCPQLKVFSQKNAGPSIARMTGLKNATGRYITFLDADDEFSKNILADACNYLKEHDADVLFQQVYRISASGELYPVIKYDNVRISDKETLRSLWCRNSVLMRGFFGGKFYSSKLLKDIDLSTDMRFAEDMYVLSDIFNKAQTGVFFPEGYYLYYERPDTPTTGEWTVQKSLWLLKAYMHRLEVAVKNNYPVDDQIHAWSHTVCLLRSEEKMFPNEDKYKEIHRQLKEFNFSYCQILSSSLNVKRKIAMCYSKLTF